MHVFNLRILLFIVYINNRFWNTLECKIMNVQSSFHGENKVITLEGVHLENGLNIILLLFDITSSSSI